MSYLNWRNDFDYFQNNSLIYLDSAATTQVLNSSLSTLYSNLANNTSVMRWGNSLSDSVVRNLDLSRATIAEYFGTDSQSLVLTYSATSAFNFIISALAVNPTHFLVGKNLHHSVLAPTMVHSGKPNAIDYYELDQDYKINLVSLETGLQKIPRNVNAVVICCHIDNSIGVIQDLSAVQNLCEKYNAVMVVDGCQAQTSNPVDFDASSIDIYIGSGHKFYSGYGVGLIFIKPTLQKQLTPWHFGGGAVKSFTFTEFEIEDMPYAFEPGSPNWPSVLVLANTVNWLQSRDLQQDIDYTLELKNQLHQILSKDGFDLVSQNQSFISSYTHEDPEKLQRFALHLRNNNVATRYGRHCAQPLHEIIGSPTLRFSLAPYNDDRDIIQLKNIMQKF